MARSLDDIMRELDASYNPQRQSLQTRIDALPAQADAEIEGLKATQNQAFEDILGGARSRGLGFSGIPLGEQAKYTSTQFLPAVARVRQSQNETRQSLFDALNNVNLQQNQYAQSLRQGELDRDEQIRQFNETLAEQRRQAAAQQAAFSGLFNNKPQQPQGLPTADQERAYQKVQELLSIRDDGRIRETIAAIQGNASRGNTYDQLKLQLLRQYAPRFFEPNQNPAPALQKVGGGEYKANGITFGGGGVNLGGITSNPGLRYL